MSPRTSTLAAWLLFIACSAGIETASAAEAYVPKPGEHHVGYRKTSIQYEGSDSEARQRSVLVWYPSKAEAKEYNYRGQIGFVTENADVATGNHPLVLFSHGFLGMPDQTIFLTE